MYPLPPQVNTALTRLNEAGFEAFVVGGAVRDLLRGAPVHDWDITTSARPEQTKSLFPDFRLVETGLKHGTVTVLADGLPLEITTYRTDGSYTDHRRPDRVEFTPSLTEDLARRDFTVNAMAYHPTEGITDPFGGQADLRARILRAVGDPDRRFGEDALRILRCLRFASRLGFSVEEHTAAALLRRRTLLAHVAPERIREELTGLLLGGSAERVLRDYADVLAVPIPEIAPLAGFSQHNPHHCHDVWGHTAAVVASVPDLPRLRWAALLHDVGKPARYTCGADGVGHFYGHAADSAQIADGILRRLRFDNAGREEIVFLTAHHHTFLEASEERLLRSLRRHGRQRTADLIHLSRGDTLGKSPRCLYRLDGFRAMLDRLGTLPQSEDRLTAKDLAVNGHDLTALGYEGPAIGLALAFLLDEVIEGRAENEKAALLARLTEQN